MQINNYTNIINGEAMLVVKLALGRMCCFVDKWDNIPHNILNLYNFKECSLSIQVINTYTNKINVSCEFSVRYECILMYAL